jgi:hypothetical protein
MVEMIMKKFRAGKNLFLMATVFDILMVMKKCLDLF